MINYHKMIRTVSVKYNGVNLECKGYYSPHRHVHRDDPPEYECFEIDSIYFNNNDVTNLIDAFNFDISELECLCLEQLKE